MTKVICLDPGHGGPDPGASANGLVEKTLALDLAKRTQKVFNDKYIGHKVILTRDKDTTLTLQKRCDIANNAKAVCFVSFHNNAGGGTGFESFVMAGASPTSAELLQKNIHEAVSPVLKKYSLRDRGRKIDTQAAVGRIHVLRATKMKACLVETLFVDTKSDAALLKNNTFLQAMAEAYADAIAKTEGLKKKTTTPTPEAPKTDDFIRVAINGEQKHAFKEKDSLVSWIEKNAKAGDTVNIKR